MVQGTVTERREIQSERNSATMCEHTSHHNEQSSRSVRRSKLIESYRNAPLKQKFEVKKVDFDNDLITSKLKKYLR